MRFSSLDKLFTRDVLVFAALLGLCIGSFGYVAVSGNKRMSRGQDQIRQNHEIIEKTLKLSSLVEGILSNQRAYMLSGKPDFLDVYEAKKASISEYIATLSELAGENKSQISRLDEIRARFNELSLRLENRTKEYRPVKISEYVLGDIDIADGLKEDILRNANAILKEEYKVLENNRERFKDEKSRYYTAMIIVALAGISALVAFWIYAFHIQSKRMSAERSLKDTEERLTLAIEGMNDGIFDWNLQSGEVFYSKRFFGMLGYERDAFIGTIENFTQLIHPDDYARIWQYMERYLHREVGDYSSVFRMKHEDGRWIWINSRAKAIFSRDGEAIRMVGAQTDITFTKEYQEKLKDEKLLAEKANRAKSDFLAHMSHEIRTPLTAISGIAEIFVKNKENLSEKQEQLVKTLHSSTSSLKDIVNDILDFSKIESGELELEETTFKIVSLFQQVISIMSVNARQKNLSFGFDFESMQDLDFYGDRLRIRQILINLIGNAIKFTAIGGVSVRAEKEDRNGSAFLKIDVIDTGIGIAPENMDVIFGRFKQADSSVSRKYGGTGLGLPISRNLAQLMGGNITAQSEPDQGSTFTVFLPIRPMSENEERSESFNLSKKLSTSLRASLTGETRILLVEDYEGNIVVLSHILDDIGCSYDIARTGIEALNLWKEKHYDLVLMDVQMPEMDGITATGQIRRMEIEGGLHPTPIIGMTAHALISDKDKCIAVGMDTFLSKPIVEADLKAQILKHLSNRKKAAA